MKSKSYILLAWLLAAHLARGQGPGQPPAPPAGAGDPATGPVLAPLKPGVMPDPAGLASDPQDGAVELPPPVPPEITETCETADCTAPVGKTRTKPKVSPVYIGPPAQRALSESHDWAENPTAMPSRDPAGRVMFPYSESAPTIVCAPIHLCDLELQAGETVQGAPHVGDAVRWKISPAVSGSDAQRVTHLIIKPTEPGLDTNLFIPTDRHTYHIRLVSSSSRFISSVGFYYPGEDQQAWTQAGKTGKSGGTTDAGSDMPSVAVNRLNFNYKVKIVKGKPRFRPLRAMDDGYHTYISMNEDLPQLEAPVLIGISSNGVEQMINYRLKGNIYVIDGTLAKLALISGVGREQERVELTRDACKARGWLGLCWDPRE
jgi:type IV secretion system protein TrbG